MTLAVSSRCDAVGVAATGQDGGVFRRLDLLPLLAPVAPALQEPFSDWRPERANFAALAAHDPAVVRAMGVVEQRPGYGPRWQIVYEAKRFWSALGNALPSIIRADPLPDGRLREVITADQVIMFWQRVRDQVFGAAPAALARDGWRPSEADLPIWGAALVACLPPEGPPWTLIAPDVMARDLPAWPLRRPITLCRVEVRGDIQHVVSACILPERLAGEPKDVLLHLSAVGHAAKLRAVWAAILNRRREAITIKIGGDWRHARRADGRNQYVTHWNDSPLPVSGYAHMALTHCSAFAPELGQDFLHLAGNDLTGAPDVARFAQQLDRAISTPFDPAWAAALWEAGRTPMPGESAPLIIPLPSLGCQGYWVRADELRWLRRIMAVQLGLPLERLAELELTIREIGAAATVDGVAELVSDDSEAGADDDDECP